MLLAVFICNNELFPAIYDILPDDQVCIIMSKTIGALYMKDKKIPTITDVAKLAGVAKSTVSHVIHKSAPISAETTRKVQQAMKKLGYQPNALAQALRGQFTNLVGLIVPDLSNFFYADIARGVARVAAQKDYSVFVCDTAYNLQTEIQEFQKLLSVQVDGIILLSVENDKEFIQRLLPRFDRLVLVDNYFADMDIPCVRIDNSEAMRKAVDHLVHLGHRNIMYISESLQLTSLRDRFYGFKRGLEEHNIPLQDEYIIFDKGLELDKVGRGRTLIREFLADRDPRRLPSAICCTSDMIAMGVIKGIKELGMAVPDDISVVGFDGIPIGEYMDPPLTTIFQPTRLMGERAMELMLMKIHKPTGVFDHILLPHTFMERGTIAVAKTLR